MSIDLAAFTPWSALAGGALIGLAACLLLLWNGRIAGISGILGSLPAALWAAPASPARGMPAWQLAFLAGLLAAPLVYAMWAPLAPIRIDADGATLVAAGLLVGIGTRYGSGCTSGHGVCGMARRSPRSLAATAVFMAAGFATVYIVRHLLH